jgi:aspartyl aminopeptidase
VHRHAADGTHHLDLEKKRAQDATGGSPAANRRSVLLKLVASELGCGVSDIVGFDLQLCDTQPSAIGGIYNEFIFSGRMVNLFSVYCAATALIQCRPDEASLAHESCIRQWCARTTTKRER